MTKYHPHELGHEALSQAMERRLFKLYREGGDLGAKERLIGQFILCARKHAGGYGHKSVLKDDDLASAAHDGMLQAMETFDYKRGKARFATYMKFRIRGCVLDAIQEIVKQNGIKDALQSTVREQSCSSFDDPSVTADVEPTRQVIMDALKLLSPREQIVVSEWMQRETYDAIGQRLGVSREYVRQILLKARAKIDPFIKARITR